MYCKKIIFTGGPCAGKTTMIELVKEYLKEKDCIVLVVPEAATEIFGIGIRYEMLKSVDNFQQMIFDYQRTKENTINNILKLNKDSNKKFIIIYDRGVLDNKAYFDDYKGFNNLLNNKYSEIDFLDNYDLVFDLITLADCNPEKYNLSSNEARTESPEVAIKLDRKTSNAWAGHRNINVINTSLTIEEEFDLIKTKLDQLLDDFYKKEIKKFEIDNDIYDFYKYNDNNSRLINVEEISVDVKPDTDIFYKIYKRNYKGKTSYIFNISYVKNGILTTVYDSKITSNEYKKIIAIYKIKNILKYKQLSFIENRQVYDVKFYKDNVVLEYEENLLNDRLILPECIKIKEKSYERERILKHIRNFI